MRGRPKKAAAAALPDMVDATAIPEELKARRAGLAASEFQAGAAGAAGNDETDKDMGVNDDDEDVEADDDAGDDKSRW